MDYTEPHPLALPNPPAEWFDPIPEDALDELLPDGQKLGFIDDDGRIGGWFWEEGVCVIAASGPGECWSPSPSPSEYHLWYQSDAHVTASTGEIVENYPVGGIVWSHANPMLDPGGVVKHYNDPNAIRMVGRAYDVPGKGGYIVGALVPHASKLDGELMKLASLSGHWGWRQNGKTADGETFSGWDCYGPCMVSSPGAPLNRNVIASTVAGHTNYYGANPEEGPAVKLDGTTYELKDGVWTADSGCAGCGDVTAAVSNFQGKRQMLEDVVKTQFSNFEYVSILDFTDDEVYFSLELRVENGDDYQYRFYKMGSTYILNGDIPVLTDNPFSVVSTYARVEAGTADDVTAATSKEETSEDETDGELTLEQRVAALETHVVSGHEAEIPDEMLTL